MTDGTSIRDLERRLDAAPASPLFARLASALLANGESARAEALCERGVELFPRYATGRLLHARCLAARGRYPDALKALEPVASGYPGNLVLADYEEEWRRRSSLEAGPVVADDGAVFIDLPADAPVAVAGETPGEADVPVDAIGPVEIAAAPVETVTAAVETTTAPVESAPVPVETAAMPVESAAAAPPDHAVPMNGYGVAPPSPVPANHAGAVPILQPVPASVNRTSFIGQDRIVSRTLAEIYANQGAITEAVVTYRLLLERMPERSEAMVERLRELEDRMRTDPGPRPGGVE